MSKYTAVQSIIYGLFGSNSWESEDIKTVPVNFLGTITDDSWIRLSIITSNNDISYQHLDCVSGLIMIDIFTKSGIGTARMYEIADRLDAHLMGLTSGKLQISSSTLSLYGKDRDNPNLFRAIYSIPFTYYGA